MTKRTASSKSNKIKSCKRAFRAWIPRRSIARTFDTRRTTCRTKTRILVYELGTTTLERLKLWKNTICLREKRSLQIEVAWPMLRLIYTALTTTYTCLRLLKISGTPVQEGYPLLQDPLTSIGFEIHLLDHGFDLSGSGRSADTQETLPSLHSPLKCFTD